MPTKAQNSWNPQAITSNYPETTMGSTGYINTNNPGEPNTRHHPNTIKIMTLNCGGLTPLTELQIRQLIPQEDIHIILLQETKRTTISTTSQYQTYHKSGNSVTDLTHPNGQHGLQTWVNTNLPTTFLRNYSKHNQYLEYITVRIHYLTIINIYRKHADIIPALQHLDHLI
jgi:exonuclease III